MSRSAIEGALVRWMPLRECMIAMYVRPGTPEAAELLAAAARCLRQARAEHKRMMAENMKRRDR